MKTFEVAQGQDARQIEGADHSPGEAAMVARSTATVYGFLATLLNERPDATFVGNLRAAGGDFIRGLAEDPRLSNDATQGFRDMAKYVEENKDRPAAAVEQDLAVDWTRLFRGVSPAFGPVPPYEASFMNTGTTEVEMIQAVNQFYRNNGLAVNNDCNNRLDYMGLEFSFLEHLAEAQAQAWDENHVEEALSYGQAERRFLAEHLGVWAGLFIERALSYAETGFYQGFLRLCSGVVSEAVD